MYIPQSSSNSYYNPYTQGAMGASNASLTPTYQYGNVQNTAPVYQSSSFNSFQPNTADMQSLMTQMMSMLQSMIAQLSSSGSSSATDTSASTTTNTNTDSSSGTSSEGSNKAKGHHHHHHGHHGKAGEGKGAHKAPGGEKNKADKVTDDNSVSDTTTSGDSKTPAPSPATSDASAASNEDISGGNVSSWIAQARKDLAAAGVPADKMSADDIATIIQHESSGDPNAVNNWDYNAQAGTPSRGLMQTIQPTFDSYKLPGHDDINNPVDNIIAGVRYAIDKYGSVSNVPGVVQVKSGGQYVGY